MHLRLILEGYLPREPDLARGPYNRIGYNETRFFPNISKPPQPAREVRKSAIQVTATLPPRLLRSLRVEQRCRVPCPSRSFSLRASSREHARRLTDQASSATIQGDSQAGEFVEARFSQSFQHAGRFRGGPPTCSHLLGVDFSWMARPQSMALHCSG